MINLVETKEKNTNIAGESN